MIRTVFYPGSFDPVTNGHVDVLAQALDIADRVVIGIGMHATKAGMFTFDERVEMIREAVAALGVAQERVEVVAFSDLAVAAARRYEAKAMIRGLRDGTDLDYEMQLAGMNAAMAREVRTVFLPATADTRHVTATLVRQIASLGGDVSAFVPASVASRLAARFSAIR